MAELPYMLLNVAELDVDTGALSDAELGTYIRLLCAMWRRPDRCIEADDKRIANIARISATRWRKQKGVLGDFLIFVDGRVTAKILTNRRPARRAIPQQLRDFIFGRDDHRCVYCGAEEDLEIDHVHPVSRGGTDDPENLATACFPCNRSKRAKTLDEWTPPNRATDGMTMQ